MKAPQKIYLQLGEDVSIKELTSQDFSSGAVTWCVDKINETDITYVLESEHQARIEKLEKRDWRQFLRLDRKNISTSDVVFIEYEFPLGSIDKDVDGYYYFIFNEMKYRANSMWTSYILHAIADMLDEVNKDWDEQVRKDMLSEMKQTSIFLP